MENKKNSTERKDEDKNLAGIAREVMDDYVRRDLSEDIRHMRYLLCYSNGRRYADYKKYH